MSEHPGLEERILNHDKQLVRIETVLERVATNQDNMTSNLSSISDTLILLADIRESTKEQIKRLDKKIDDSEVRTNEKFAKLKPIFALVSYPAVVGFALVGLYAMSYVEFRAGILSTIKSFGG